MIVHDSTFEALATSTIKGNVDAIVVRQIFDGSGLVDDTLVWTSSDALMEVDIDAVGTMLGQGTKKATVKMLGIQDASAVGDIFKIRTGIFDPDTSSFNYISQGYFIVDSIAYDHEKGSTTVVLYDHMWKAANMLYNETVTEGLITFPITVADYAAVIADLIGCDLMTRFDSLPNAGYYIAQDPYSAISGATIQTAIMDIAGATGTTARISDTTLVFSQYNVSSEDLTSNELKKLKIGDTYGPVTSVILGRVPQNDNIALYSSLPTSLTIENVNTSTNKLTITDNGMTDGNMIQFAPGSLPAPLVANKSYYVFTDGSDDTFALANNYMDAVAGANLVDITTTGSGTISVLNLATKEIQINNNEILDDDRQTLLPPLYNTLSGIDWTAVNAETVGLGWHEIGDVISFTQGATTVRAFISEIHLVIAGSIKETLISIVPDIAAIDYATAGSIVKTLYNTEIKVDKQNQQITSVVSRQDVIEGQINESFAEINQDVNNVMITIQRAGGGNILYNSVGFAKETFRDVNSVSYDKLLYWDYNDPYDISVNGRATSYSSSESQAAGGISGQVIEMAGADMSIKQRVTVGAGVPLCFALMVNNALGTGTATITISNTSDFQQITIDNTRNYNWEEIKIENFTSTLPWLDVEIQVSSAIKFVFTDLRLMYGSTTQGWVQANGEILSANVQFTTDGVRVFDSVHDTETRMTYNEFSTRRKTDNEVLFEADDFGIVTNNLSINGKTSYINKGDTIVKQLTVGKSNPKAGLAFIKATE